MKKILFVLIIIGLVLISGCVEETNEKGEIIKIASQTDEAKAFLKLYPNAEIHAEKTPCVEYVVRSFGPRKIHYVCKEEERDWNWLVGYPGTVVIAIDADTKEVLASYIYPPSFDTYTITFDKILDVNELVELFRKNDIEIYITGPYISASIDRIVDNQSITIGFYVRINETRYGIDKTVIKIQYEPKEFETSASSLKEDLIRVQNSFIGAGDFITKIIKDKYNIEPSSQEFDRYPKLKR